MSISPLAAVMYCIAALGAALGLFALLSFRGERDSPYRLFGVFLHALAIDAIGTAMLTDARDLTAGFQAQRVQLVGQAVALVAFVDFYVRASDARGPLALGARVASLGLVVVAASGWMLVAGQASPPAALALPWAQPYPEVELSPLGLGAYVVATAMVGHGVVRLRRAQREVVNPAMFYAFVIAFVCVVHDQAMRFGLIESIYLLEVSSLACMLAVSLTQARRFLRESGDLERRSEELEASHARLRDARDALIQTRRLAAIGELSAVIAHEVRNPLAVIKNAIAGLRRREALTVERRGELLAISGEEVTRLRQLVDDMLTYAKPLQPELARHGPAQLIEAALERARAEPGAPEGVPIVIDGRCGDGVELRCDARMVVQALANIVSNALHASPVGEAVHVRVREVSSAPAGTPGAGVELVVCDSGPGMDDATRRKALDPFFTTRPRGMGLGLAIAERIARAHRGSLELRPNGPSGTAVSLLLPL